MYLICHTFPSKEWEDKITLSDISKVYITAKDKYIGKDLKEWGQLGRGSLTALSVHQFKIISTCSYGYQVNQNGMERKHFSRLIRV